MRKLCLQNQKFSAERLHLLTELKAAEKELAELRSQNEGQLRLIQNVTGHQKNKGALLDDSSKSAASTAI